ncbi:hypothetical protein [Vreelandella massiliensis]|uniref:hypothetical protein n=1 Tax=Vreelandella massiliensis TaxID=1816686 RepID=UPI00096A78FC|nr:hypothetical protein [Halomonas massiliensis]
MQWLNPDAVRQKDHRRLLMYAGIFSAVLLVMGGWLYAGGLVYHGHLVFAGVVIFGAITLISGVMHVFPVVHWALLPLVLAGMALPLFPTFQYEILRLTDIDLIGMKSLMVAIPAAMMLFGRVVWSGYLSDPRYVKIIDSN